MISAIGNHLAYRNTVDDFFAFLMPLEWLVANIMVAFHTGLTWLGMEESSGASWALSIVGLVIVIRMLLIPLFVKQIKASRAMQIIAPDLKKIQAKYKGKKDQASREAMSRETMELYAKHKTNPFASCLPILVQAPIFFALFRVLNYRVRDGLDGEGIGWLTPQLAEQVNQASLFGAQLSDTFLQSEGITVKVVAAISAEQARLPGCGWAVSHRSSPSVRRAYSSASSITRRALGMQS